MVRKIGGIDSKLALLVNPNANEENLIRLTAQAHGVLKEHIWR